jgi:hypothetical protein
MLCSVMGEAAGEKVWCSALCGESGSGAYADIGGATSHTYTPVGTKQLRKLLVVVN